MINTVQNIDCLIGMQSIPDKSIDMILCDLPYGTTNLEWDECIDLKKLFEEYNRIIKDNGAIVLTGQQPFTTDLINANRKYFRYEIIWEKTQKMGFLSANKRPLRAHENILLFYKSQCTYNAQKTINTETIGKVREKTGKRSGHYSSFLEGKFVDDGTRHPTSVLKISNWNGTLFGKNHNAVKHPTQKPLKLFEWLIKTYTNEESTVLDNCMGSGTTAIACINTGRNYIGFEKEKKYFDIIMDRIKNHVVQLKMIA